MLQRRTPHCILHKLWAPPGDSYRARCPPRRHRLLSSTMHLCSARIERELTARGSCIWKDCKVTRARKIKITVEIAHASSSLIHSATPTLGSLLFSLSLVLVPLNVRPVYIFYGQASLQKIKPNDEYILAIGRDTVAHDQTRVKVLPYCFAKLEPLTQDQYYLIHSATSSVSFPSKQPDLEDFGKAQASSSSRLHFLIQLAQNVRFVSRGCIRYTS
jgi:hypothetical protein